MKARRRALMARVESGRRLPAAFQEVEYLESSDSQSPYIETRIKMPKEIVCVEELVILKNADQYGWGAISSNGFSAAGFGFYGGRLQYNYSGQYVFRQAPPISIGERCNTKLVLLDGSQTSYKDGVSDPSWVASISNTKSVEGLNIFLFKANGNSNRGPMRLYYIKFLTPDERTILGEFIPCYRKSDNEPGMYDLCGSICPLTNSPFYINAGTGEFLVGPDVN